MYKTDNYIYLATYFERMFSQTNSENFREKVANKWINKGHTSVSLVGLVAVCTSKVQFALLTVR